MVSGDSMETIEKEHQPRLCLVSPPESEDEDSFAEELDEIAIHIPDAKCTQPQVAQLCSVEVNLDTCLLQLGENVVKVMDREAGLEYPMNLEWILDPRYGFRQLPRCGILDEFEYIVVRSKQRESQIFSHLAFFHQMESQFLLVPAGSDRGIGRRQGDERAGNVLHDCRLRPKRPLAAETCGSKKSQQQGGSTIRHLALLRPISKPFPE